MAETTNEQMLKKLGVPDFLIKGRRGNFMEIARATRQGQLTRTEIFDELGRAGVIEEFKALTPELKTTVTDGIARIWMLRRKGEAITESDEQQLGGISEIADIHTSLRRGLERYGDSWLPFAVKSLVGLASCVDQKERAKHAGGTLDATSDYVSKLWSTQDQYQEAKGRIDDYQRKEQVHNYLRERDERVGELQTDNYQLKRQVITPLFERKPSEGK